MSTMYYAAFDASLFGSLGKITLTRAAFSDIEVSFADVTDTAVDGTSTSSIFFHAVYDGLNVYQRVTGQDPQSTVKLQHYARRTWARALSAALNAAASSASWTTPDGFNFNQITSTGLYTLSSGYAIGYAFSTAAGAALMGFSSLTGSANTTHSGTLVPTYTIAATLPSVSQNTPNFEPDGIANHWETDSGSGGGTSRTVSPQYRTFVQEFETKAKTIREAAVSAHPWTFDHLKEHCRGQFAFIVIDGFGAGTNEVFSLRTGSTSKHPRRATEGNDAQFHIDFDTSVEGTIAVYTP